MVFEDVLLIDDQCQDAIVGLGVCKLTSGEIDEGIRLIGNSINNREKCSYFNTAAICLVKRQDFKQALDLYLISMKYAAADEGLVSSLCFNIGLLYLKDSEVSKSIKFFEKALEYNPFNVDARHNLEILKERTDMSSTNAKSIEFDDEHLNDLMHAI